MCFFIQSCEPLGGGKKERKKNAHHSSVSLVSYLPPLPPPSPHSSTDRNLPVADLHVLVTQTTPRLFPHSHLLGPGRSPAPKTPLGAGADLCRWSQPMGAPCYPHFTPQPQLPTPCPISWASPRAEQLAHYSSAVAKSNQSSAARWVPFFPPMSAHTCRLATVALCDAALFGRSRCTRLESALHKLHSLFLTRVRAAFPGWGKVQQAGGLPREA